MDGGKRQHVADIIETIARVVRREVHREISVYQTKVPDGIIILRAVKPTDRHRTGVNFSPELRTINQAVHLALQLLDFGKRGPNLFLSRRHFADRYLIEHFAPKPLLREHLVVVLDGFEIDFSLGQIIAVTFVTIFIQEGFDAFLKILTGGRATP